MAQRQEVKVDILIELATEAKADGDSLEEWLSTLNSHLILMLQQGRLPQGADINQMVSDAPKAWEMSK